MASHCLQKPEGHGIPVKPPLISVFSANLSYVSQLSLMSSTVNGVSSSLEKVTLKALDGTTISGSDLWANGPVLVICLRRPGCCEYIVLVENLLDGWIFVWNEQRWW